MIIKKCVITILLSIMAGIGLVPAGSGAERTEAILPDVGRTVSLEGYGIERVLPPDKTAPLPRPLLAWCRRNKLL